MRVPAANIWETRIQAVCSVISAQDENDVELWMCGNFGQASLTQQYVIVNPNCLYPIEQVIRRRRRFAINIFAASQRDAALRIINVRRRTPGKTKVLGLPVAVENEYGIPYIGDCLRTVFCEVEQTLETGDHTVFIARVLESRAHPQHSGERVLHYPEVSGAPSRYPKFSRMVRRAVTVTGAKDYLRGFLAKRRGLVTVDLPKNTYVIGGQTAEELAAILQPGVKDLGRMIAPPERAPAVLRNTVGLCVVGVGQWGSYHAQLFSQADPKVDLYVCGRNERRVAAVARACGAKGYILGLEQAVADPRIQALSLALPHHLHPSAAEMAAAAGKHVLVEKPIATTLADADAMIHAARKAGTILMVAEDMHFRPAVREAVNAIARGDIGEPLYMNVRAGGLRRPEGWQADKDLMGGGVMMDIGVHYVRALRLIMGEPDQVLATSAMQLNTKMSGEESAQVLYSSRYGWQAHMLLSWAGPRGLGPDIVIAGDRGVLQLWPGSKFYDYYPAATRPLPAALSYVRPSWLAEKLIKPEMQRVRRVIADSDCLGYLTEMREFLSAVSEGRQPVTRAEDGRRDVEIILNAYASLAGGGWVNTKPAI